MTYFVGIATNDKDLPFGWVLIARDHAQNQSLTCNKLVFPYSQNNTQDSFNATIWLDETWSRGVY